MLSIQDAIVLAIADHPNWKPAPVPLTNFYFEEYEVCPAISAAFGQCLACHGSGFVWEHCMTTGEDEKDVCLDCEGSGRA